MNELIEQTCNIWSEDSLRLICAPCVLAKDTFLYLQEIGHFKTASPYSTERANLPSFLILYTLSGEGVLEIDGQRISLGAGSCMFLDCMQHHRYYTPPNGTWEFLWAHFYGNGSMGYYQLFSKNASYVAHIGEDMFLQELFWSMIRRQQDWKVSDEISIHQELVSVLSRILLACTNAGHPNSVMPDYIHKAVREIERNCKDSFSLEGLAERYGVSKYHFSRAFKQYIGMNFSEYVTHARMKRARELLRYTDKPITDVAEACGLYDVSYFIRLFRSREGCTPLVYRKQWGTAMKSAKRQIRNH